MQIFRSIDAEAQSIATYAIDKHRAFSNEPIALIVSQSKRFLFLELAESRQALGIAQNGFGDCTSVLAIGLPVLTCMLTVTFRDETRTSKTIISAASNAFAKQRP